MGEASDLSSDAYIAFCFRFVPGARDKQCDLCPLVPLVLRTISICQELDLSY